MFSASIQQNCQITVDCKIYSKQSAQQYFDDDENKLLFEKDLKIEVDPLKEKKLQMRAQQERILELEERVQSKRVCFYALQRS